MKVTRCCNSKSLMLSIFYETGYKITNIYIKVLYKALGTYAHLLHLYKVLSIKVL